VSTAGEIAYTVQGLLIHDQCFRCSDCGRMLGLDTFLWAGNFLYCRQHYFDRFARSCAACGELALDAMLWLNGNFYHANCLDCDRCHRSLWPGHYMDRTSKCDAPLQAATRIAMSSLTIATHPPVLRCFPCRVPACANCNRPAVSSLFDKAPLIETDAIKLLQAVSQVGGFFLYVRSDPPATPVSARPKAHELSKYWITYW